MTTSWIIRATAENQEVPETPTVKTVKTEVMSVLAVTASGDLEKKKWLKEWLNTHHALVEKRGFGENEASEEASLWLLIDAMNLQPVQQPDISICCKCNQPLTDQGLPFLSASGHAWLHRGCHGDWGAALRTKTMQMLQAHGIPFDPTPAIASINHSDDRGVKC